MMHCSIYLALIFAAVALAAPFESSISPSQYSGEGSGIGGRKFDAARSGRPGMRQNMMGNSGSLSV
ncbi:hypothetical protein PGT21_020189 [Puccinia graminis f. sp. tritici]|nr:hypothetical protein PGT21_020189 [Puccinia graminis f. sp. tritici]